MISVAEASRQVLERVHPGSRQSLPLLDGTGLVLAEEIQCTRDSPPFDKSLVDGYAVRAKDISDTGAELRILEEVTAGRMPTQPVTAGCATRIMTGVAIPEGADAIVMVEDTEANDVEGKAARVLVRSGPTRSGQNIMRRGEAMRVGDTVLKTGHRLRAIEIGLLAELGICDVTVFVQPTVAVLATGDELVGYNESPGDGQIRDSNGPMLRQLVREAGGIPRELGIARDDESKLEQLIRRGLECDVLILSGGVSEGVLDLVPQVLRRLGVVQVFHKVNLKPGKPLWFGVFQSAGTADKLIFGMPGNPVSGLVCFHLFARPALARLAGEAKNNIRTGRAVLASAFRTRGNRPVYHPGRTLEREGDLVVEPLNWRGSADLRSLVDADVLIHFPAGEAEFRASESVHIDWLS